MHVHLSFVNMPMGIPKYRCSCANQRVCLFRVCRETLGGHVATAPFEGSVTRAASTLLTYFVLREQVSSFAPVRKMWPPGSFNIAIFQRARGWTEAICIIHWVLIASDFLRRVHLSCILVFGYSQWHHSAVAPVTPSFLKMFLLKAVGLTLIKSASRTIGRVPCTVCTY